MFINFISIIVMAISFWLLGRFVIKNLMKLNNQFAFAYSVVGSTIEVVIVSFLYFRLGLSLTAITAIVAVSTTVVFIIQIKSIHTEELPTLIIQAAIFMILITPGLIHGEQYYVYRGNFFDQFIYISEGITAHNYTWPQLREMALHAPNDVYKFGIDLLTNDRPPVTLVYALLLTGGKGSLFFATYLYHAMFMSMIFAPMCEMVKHITKNYYVAVIITLGYIFGFYGQIQFDINAWSHICSIALFITNAYISMMFFEDAFRSRDEKNVCNYRILALMNMIMIGGMMYYVENWSIQYVLSCLVILIMCIIKKFKISIKHFIAMLTVPLSSLIIAVISCPQVINFLQHQITSSIDGKVDYGEYWYNWILGFWNVDAMPDIAMIPAILTSLFGASVYVPAWDKNKYLVVIWILVFVVTSALLVINIGARLGKSIKCENISEQFMSIWLCVCIIMGIALYYKAGHYGFIKYILYVSPYLWISATLSITDCLIDKKYTAIKLITLLSAISIVLSSVAMVGLRTIDTFKNEKCYGYSGTYPSDQDPGLKNSHLFNLDLEKIKDADVVQIEEEFPFYLYYMKLSLLYAGKEYYSQDNHVYYVNDDVIMKKPDRIDATITLEENLEGMLEPVYYYNNPYTTVKDTYVK